MSTREDTMPKLDDGRASTPNPEGKLDFRNSAGLGKELWRQIDT